jgi:hypothetical protein
VVIDMVKPSNIQKHNDIQNQFEVLVAPGHSS